MADATTSTTISRRSTRIFLEQQDSMEVGAAGHMEHESRHGSEEKEQERPQRAQKPQLKVPCPNSIEAPMIPLVDFGTDLCGVFPSTAGDMEDHIARSLQAAKEDKSRGEGRPINFGIVVPGAVYRSSFPMTEDFHFLGTLGLKTVISLVKKDFSPEFRAFIKEQGIHHVVIDMQGTKKVEISEAIMRSVLEVALNKANHPLLIHCNHGKHRTGCAVAVIRHVAGWRVDSIVKEYQGFAEPKVRECDIKYITEYEVSRLEGLFTETPRSRNAVLTSWKMCKYIVGTALALSFWISTALFLERR